MSAVARRQRPLFIAIPSEDIALLAETLLPVAVPA